MNRDSLSIYVVMRQRVFNTMHSIYQDLKPITKDTDWYALPLPHTENFIIPYINLQIPETMRAYETD
jgi:hypothetical protein